MKWKISLFLVFITTVITSKSQPFYGWTADATTTGPGNFEIKANATTVDAQGNVYTTGYFRGTVDFDPGAGTANLVSNGSNYDIFISKINTNGSFMWTKSMGSTSNLGDYGIGIAIDWKGNIHLTGSFSGTADFDPGTGVTTLVSNGGTDMFVQKLDSSGNLVWAKGFGSNIGDESKSIAVDIAGNIYTTGTFQNTVDFDPGSGTVNLTSAGGNDVFILKLDVNGNYAWVKSIGGSNMFGETAYAIAVDGSGSVYTTGIFEGLIDFDPNSGTAFLSSAGNFDVFIVKLDMNGNYMWAKNMGGSNNEAAYAIAVDGSGNVFTTGYFQGTADFDPGTSIAELISAGGKDIFISKLNATGDFVWARNIGTISTEYGYSIAVDGSPNANVYTTGYFAGTVDFDPGSGVHNLTSNGGSDFFIQKLDPSGNLSWAYNVGGEIGDEANSIALDGSGNIYTAGLFRNTVDMNPLSGIDIKTANNIALFTQKISQCNSSVLANHLDNSTLLSRNVGGYYLEFMQNCRLIARYEPIENGIPLQGSITAKVWVESTQPGNIGNEFVRRHYEITPATNSSTTSGKITLYFTQSEFDDFNSVSSIDLPVNNSDGIGKANLRIEKRGGVSSDGSGLPNTYPGAVTIINPGDDNIIWNSTMSRWEVSFNVTGFSGFFVKTQSSVLPVRFFSVSGKLTAANLPQVNWQVQETNVKNFILEKTINNSHWVDITNIESKGDGTNSYSFTEANPLHDVTYYRVRQVDKDNKVSYSSIIKIAASTTAFAVEVFPNPSNNNVNIRNARTGSKIVISDLCGRSLQQLIVKENISNINISHFPKGVYILTIGNEVVYKIIKE